MRSESVERRGGIGRRLAFVLRGKQVRDQGPDRFAAGGVRGDGVAQHDDFRASGAALGEAGLLIGHQVADLAAGQRAGQIAQHPAGRKERRTVVVHVVHHELPALQAGQRLVHSGMVEARPGLQARPLQSFEHPHFIPLRLEPAEEPRPRVGQRFIIHVDRVLRRQHQPHAVRPCLFEQREEQPLGRRLGDRREVAEDFVHIQQRPQTAGALLLAGPGEEFAQQQGDEEHPFRVGQVGDAEDADPRPAVVRIEQLFNIQRLPLQPAGEGRRGQQVVHPHRQPAAVLAGIKGLEIEDPHPIERRIGDATDEIR
ncbi:hypothetical protein LzC2_40040 [Planctomycetes bacterium LzC2]|uniref:Uncharacterized protein n=1 Tax=Alienimonas chondri TaxID=2681879 RepID=A0ABX1VLD4_9PLAN|nr:hypothetical protein [Alienimonas chondri]